jgi:hypothetical protein
MIPHKCIVKHDPPHSYGDCARAAWASLLNFERIEDVPHFLENGGGDPEATHQHQVRWLRSQGFVPFMIAFPGSATVDDVLCAMGSMNPNVFYLLHHDRDGTDHVVICCDNKIVHDPAWYSTPITGPHSNGYWAVITLVPLSLCK